MLIHNEVKLTTMIIGEKVAIKIAVQRLALPTNFMKAKINLTVLLQLLTFINNFKKVIK
jgi:hypothetical protein